VHHLLAELYEGVDWVLVEGFKDSDLLKIEVWRAPRRPAGRPCATPTTICRRRATDAPARLPVPTQLPVLDLNQPAPGGAVAAGAGRAL
jgi:molybdopterin-guanine dinucleotide biosynthesis protein B